MLFKGRLNSLKAGNITQLDGKYVLFISSYDSSFPTYFSQIKGLHSELSKYYINLTTMYMNKKRDISSYGDSVFIHQLKYIMSLKPRISGVIVGDDDAFSFALNEENKLFKGIPIVFLGVNNENLAFKQDSNINVTGVVEAISIDKTLDLIYQLLPNTKRIFAISDATKSGRADLESFLKITSLRSDGEYSVIDLSKMSFSEYKKTLSNLNNDDALLLLSCFLYKNDSIVSFHRTIDILKEFSPVPVFHLWEHGIGEGLLGGYVVSHYDQGALAAKLLVEKLIHNDRNIPVTKKSPNKVILDNNIIKKYSINLHNIPNSSEVKILNAKINIFQKYRDLIVIISIVFFILIFIITFLLYSSFKNKQVRILLEDKKEEAEKANLLKSSFLANMSHEIRTPLNAIIGFSDILTDEEITSDEKKQYSAIINSNSDLLLKLINDILDLSKIDAGYCVLEYQKIDIVHLIKNICLSLRDSASKRNNELVYNLYIDSLEIEYDPNRFKQVLNNLISNAIKFTKNGKIEVILEDLDKFIQICVKDNGIGIAPDKQKDVFKRFAKLNTYTQGTGLGLSLSKYIVESSNGKMYFTSKLNEGSCFIVEIPKKRMYNV